MDRTALIDAIAAERPYLVAVAARALRNPEQAEDMVQSTLAAALSAAGQYRGGSSLRTWLVSILRNRMIDAHRARIREPLLEDLPARPESAGSAPDPAEVFEAAELARCLSRGMDALPRAVRAAFVMRQLEGRSGGEICRRLKLTRPRYWHALHRARRALGSVVEGQALDLPIMGASRLQP